MSVTRELIEHEQHLVLILPQAMLTDTPDVMQASYAGWKEAVPPTEAQPGQRKRGGGEKGILSGDDFSGDNSATLTSIMQRVLAFPVESKSPIESMLFLADIKQRLALLI